MKKRLIISITAVLLVVMLASIFVACTPSEEKVEKKFDEEGYTALPSVTIEGYTAKVLAKITSGDMITIIWVEDKDKAEELYESLKTDDSKENLYKKGTAIAYGTADAIEIFKKII